MIGSITDAIRGETWEPARFLAEIGSRLEILESLGVHKGTYVIIAHGGTPEFFADLFAVWYLGACAVCVDPSMTATEFANIGEFLSPTLLLVDDPLSSCVDLKIPIACTRKQVRLTSDLRAFMFGGNLDEPALILFTSGTSGNPKGVVHSFRSLMTRLALNRMHIGDEVLANTYCVLPTHFGHGLIGNCLTPLYAKAHLVIGSVQNIRSTTDLGTVLDTFGITFMSSVPAFWKLVLKMAKQPSIGTLNQVSVGSAPLSEQLWRGIVNWSGTDNVVNMYGITEAANWLSGASARDYIPADGCVGKMWGGLAFVSDKDDNLSLLGEGELMVQTPSIMMGYYKRQKLTSTVFRNGCFRTGDSARIDTDGTIWLIGRKSTQINRAGLKIHPEDIDLLLERHTEVVEACTFGFPDEISGEIVAVAVKSTQGNKLDIRELRAWCLERIRRESVPEKWFVVDDIPKTDRGKIDRQAVMDHCSKMAQAR